MEGVRQDETRAKAAWAAGSLHFMQGDIEQAENYLRASVQLWEQIADPPQLCLGLAYAKVVLGRVTQKYDEALKLEKESLQTFRTLQDRWGEALAMNDQGYVLIGNERCEDAKCSYERSIRLWEELGDSWGLPLALSNLGFFYCYLDINEELASATLSRALTIQEEAGDAWGRAETLKYLAELDRRRQQLDAARQRFTESLKLHDRLGRKQLVVDCLLGLARLAVDRAAVIEEPLQTAHVLPTSKGHALLVYAVRLFAAGTEHVLSHRHPLPHREISMNAPFCKEAQRYLGSKDYELQWSFGKALGLQAAVDLAWTINEPGVWH